MLLTQANRLFVLTGAGISAESGLATFRGSGGLWNGYRVEQVATPEAWEADPELVWRFYSMRRRDALAAQPNAAHYALARVEEKLGDRFFLCTQNVDNLHELAGSQRVHHMHGMLFSPDVLAVRLRSPIKRTTRRIYRCASNVAIQFALTLCGSAKFPLTWMVLTANSVAHPTCWL